MKFFQARKEAQREAKNQKETLNNERLFAKDWLQDKELNGLQKALIKQEIRKLDAAIKIIDKQKPWPCTIM